MIFEIEKNSPARSHQIAHNLRAGGGIQLHADFVGKYRIADRRHDAVRSARGGNIQGNNQFLTGVGVSNVNLLRVWGRDEVGQSRLHPLQCRTFNEVPPAGGWRQ